MVWAAAGQRWGRVDGRSTAPTGGAGERRDEGAAVAAHAAEESPRTGGWAVERTDVGALAARIRRYWWLVVVVTGVAVAGALAATATAPTTYVGRTALIVSSNDRSPDQDAVLVQGYVTYFNDGAYQGQLLASVGLDGDVSLSAEAAAASPILVISATTSDPQTAQSYAVQVADAFRADINRIRAESKAQELVALQDQLDTALGSNDPNAQVVVAELQDQVEQVRGDQVNVLQELQAQGGVSAESPSLLSNLLPAVAGGLLLGCLGALAASGASRRIRTALDVTQKVGLSTLVELPPPGSGTGRARHDQRLGQLANIVRARLAGPGVVAVAQPEDGSASPAVARQLAREWARQGYPTILVTATGRILDGVDTATPRVRPGPVPGLSLLELTPRSPDDPPALSVSGIKELLGQEAVAGQYVVVEAPGVERSAAAQAICHAADQTVLVVDTRVTRVPTAREAVAVLRQMGAPLMGAVVATVGEDSGEDGGAPGDRPAPGTRSRASSNGHHSGEAAPLRSDVDERVGPPPIDGASSAGSRLGARPSRE